MLPPADICIAVALLVVPLIVVTLLFDVQDSRVKEVAVGAGLVLAINLAVIFFWWRDGKLLIDGIFRIVNMVAAVLCSICLIGLIVLKKLIKRKS